MFFYKACKNIQFKIVIIKSELTFSAIRIKLDWCRRGTRSAFYRMLSCLVYPPDKPFSSQ